jgi:hypothetical protein
MQGSIEKQHAIEVEKKIEAELKRLSRSANTPTSKINQKRFRRTHANVKKAKVIQESNKLQ